MVNPSFISIITFALPLGQTVIIMVVSDRYNFVFDFRKSIMKIFIGFRVGEVNRYVDIGRCIFKTNYATQTFELPISIICLLLREFSV